MRVVLLVTDLERGGTPLRIAHLAPRLQAAGVDVRVGCLGPSGPVSRQLGEGRVPTFACDARNARDFAALHRLCGHLRRIRPDLVHATLTHANVAARLAGLILRTPVLTSTATIERERRWHRFAELLTAPLDRGHIVNSHTLAAHVQRAFHISWARIHMIPAAIEAVPQRIDRGAARRVLGLTDDEFVALWVGRFDPVKRLELVVQCAAILKSSPCRFLLAGDGPTRPAIERLTEHCGCADRVRFLGWQDDLGPIMSAADVLLFPSLTEGMPNAVLEAMAFGLPVVGSDIPTLRELAADEGRLLLVKGNEPQAYADALLDLRENPDRRRALAERAARWAREHLDPDATVRALLRVYEQTLRA